MILNILLLLCFLSSFSMASHKDVGGGNGVGNVLLDRKLYSKAKALNRNQLYSELAEQKNEVFQRFPFLKDLSFEVIQSKTWFLDSNEFSKDCENPTVYKVKKTIWACQNSVEVRISKKFWSQANLEQKTDLIFHEVITSLWLNSEVQKPINMAVDAFLNLDLDPLEVQRRVLSTGLPVFLTKDQIFYYTQEMIVYAKKSCFFKDDPSHFLKWASMSSVKNENGLFLFTMVFQDALRKNPCLSIDQKQAYRFLWERFKSLNSFF